MIVMLAAVGAVLGGFYWFQGFKAGIIKGVMASMANPPQTVSTVIASVQEWQSHLQAVGTLRAVNGADLSLEVPGVVDRIGFQSGDDVQAGTVLLSLRAGDDIAKLHALQAAADLAQVTYDRDAKQLKVAAISQAALDADLFNLRAAKAQAEQQQALLDKKTLRAPFDGHLGLRAADLGQYLNAGTTVVTLQALDTMYLDFFLPQQSLDQVKTGQSIAARVDTWPGQSFAGKVVAIAPVVDTNSRNVQVRAALANPDRKLLPGMFATVEIDLGKPERLITLPQTAITFNPYGNTVFVVDGSSVRQTFVTTGAARGDQIAVLTGIKAGDVAVTAGQMKLRNGSPVAVDNSIQPSNDAAPKPNDR
jgi:membrane fusion protein (multidrug efflux system)